MDKKKVTPLMLAVKNGKIKNVKYIFVHLLLITEIVSILNEYVKPAVASDGGNIEFESYDANEKKVRVILQGACSGCPSSTVTLKNGIETMLREMLQGKVAYVEAING